MGGGSPDCGMLGEQIMGDLLLLQAGLQNVLSIGSMRWVGIMSVFSIVPCSYDRQNRDLGPSRWQVNVLLY